MSGATCIKFDPGERSVDSLISEIVQSHDRIDEDQVTEMDDGTVVVYVSAGNFGNPFSIPCNRVLSFWQNDTSMSGGGTLYEWTGGKFVEIDQQWDEDYGRASYEYFKQEYGMKPHPPKRRFERE